MFKNMIALIMITSAHSYLGIDEKFLQKNPTGNYLYLNRVLRDNTNNP